MNDMDIKLLMNDGNKLEIRINRCQPGVDRTAQRDCSRSQENIVKLKQKTIGKKEKEAGLRDYIKYYSAI